MRKSIELITAVSKLFWSLGFYFIGLGFFLKVVTSVAKPVKEEASGLERYK